MESAKQDGFSPENDSVRHLAEDSVAKLLLHYSAPAIAALIALAVYETADGLFVGRFVGEKGLSAVMLGFPFFMFLHACCNVARVGGVSVVSRFLGGDEPAKAARAMGAVFILLVVFGLVAAVICVIMAGPVVELCGATADIMEDSTTYAAIIGCGAPFLFLTFGASSLMRATGHPNKALAIILISCAANIVLDAVLVGALSMGVAGAAISTVLSQMGGTFYGLAHFFKRSGPFRPQSPFNGDFFKTAKEICGIGIGYAMLELNLIATMIIMLNALGAYGDASALAQNFIVESCIAFLYLPLSGIDEALQPIIGYNHGAGNKDRVKNAIRYSLGAATFFLVLALLAIQFGAEIIPAFFVNEGPEFTLQAARALRIVFIAAPLVAAMFIIPAILSSLGDVKMNLVLTIAPSIAVQIPLLLVLPRFIGVDGVWLSFPAYDAAGAALGVLFLMKGLKIYGYG